MLSIAELSKRLRYEEAYGPISNKIYNRKIDVCRSGVNCPQARLRC